MEDASSSSSDDEEAPAHSFARKSSKQAPLSRTELESLRLSGRHEPSSEEKSVSLKDHHELLLYLQSDVDDGCGPRPYRLDPPKRSEAVYLQSSHVKNFFFREKNLKKKREILGKNDQQDWSKKLERFLNAFFMAVQGALAGYAAAVASVEYALEENERLVEHYGQVSNLFRRWSYLLSTMALIGALNKVQVAHQDREYWKKLELAARVELRVLVVLYLGAFVISLACSNVDVSMTVDFGTEGSEHGKWQETFQQGGLLSLAAWRTLVWVRFLLATAGWLLSCRRNDRLLLDATDLKKDRQPTVQLVKGQQEV